MTSKFLGGAVLALTLVGFGGAAAAQDKAADVTARANEARTTDEHADVAKRYRMLADTFAMEAAKHEARAERLARTAAPVVHKWPAMAPRELTESKAQAAAARRMAQEHRELAAKHQALAVEGLPAQQ